MLAFQAPVSRQERLFGPAHLPQRPYWKNVATGQAGGFLGIFQGDSPSPALGRARSTSFVCLRLLPYHRVHDRRPAFALSNAPLRARSPGVGSLCLFSNGVPFFLGPPPDAAPVGSPGLSLSLRARHPGPSIHPRNSLTPLHHCAMMILMNYSGILRISPEFSKNPRKSAHSEAVFRRLSNHVGVEIRAAAPCRRLNFERIFWSVIRASPLRGRVLPGSASLRSASPTGLTATLPPPDAKSGDGQGPRPT